MRHLRIIEVLDKEVPSSGPLHRENARLPIFDFLPRCLRDKTNLATIDQLQLEKADIQASLNALEADKRKNQQVINNLSAAIRAGASDPANKVALSPVLKSTVDAIQRQRAGREGGSK